jgi:periplasmic divalent cation tolerance protein
MDQNQDIAILYTPCGSEDEAASLARVLLSERLIACGNIYRSRSLYTWDGELADEAEYTLIAKTTATLADSAAQRINDLHRYDVPCILTIKPTGANEKYSQWVAAQLVGGLHAADRTEKIEA